MIACAAEFSAWLDTRIAEKQAALLRTRIERLRDILKTELAELG